MSFPDDLPLNWDTWLDEPRRDSLALGRVLGEGRVRYAALIGLAQRLKMSPEPLGREAYYVLDRLVAPLSDVLEEPPGSWATDYLAKRGDAIARSAVEDISSLDAIHGALLQCGMGEVVIGRTPRAKHLLPELREALVSELARRVYQMLDEIRIRGAWELHESDKPQRIVRAHSRDLRSAS